MNAGRGLRYRKQSNLLVYPRNIFGRSWSAGLLIGLLGLLQGQAQIQFDVFLGYDGIIQEATWMPVVCEVKNDGPGFNGTVEVSTTSQGEDSVIRLPVELPTGTLKRVVLPVFVHSASFSGWDIRLRDDRGKVRSEHLSAQPRRRVPRRVPLVGAIPRTPGGTPVLQAPATDAAELQPAAARFQAAIFPDNPLVLSGMSLLYLNSEKAPELRSTQASAILSWIKCGGHLVVGIEQGGDLNGAPWLKAILPCQLGEVTTNSRPWALQQWLRAAPLHNPGSVSTIVSPNPYESLPGDNAFEGASMLLTSCRVRDGQVLAADGPTPFIVSAPRGKGRVSVLLFSPEREPARSWKNLPSLWTRLSNVPPGWLPAADNSNIAGWSSDALFAAMLETTQVQTLPVRWLLVLLLAYLLVIGPLDQYWLKRIGKPMLTWITFPCYVIFFSLLIYGIGYKLRAGDSEWNELHIVDVLSTGAQAELRGASYLSAYSPANETYQLDSPHPVGTLRGKFSSFSNPQAGDQVRVTQNGDTFKAEVFVPVWSSRLFVSDWLANGESPLNVTISAAPDAWLVRAENRTIRALTNLHLAVDGHLCRLSEIGPRQIRDWRLPRTRQPSGAADEVEEISEFLFRHNAAFSQAIQFQGRAFGASNMGRIADTPNAAIAASFLSLRPNESNVQGAGYVTPPGLDLTATLGSGGAVLFAWDPDFSPSAKLYRFMPKRVHQNTLWRVVVPVQ